MRDTETKDFVMAFHLMRNNLAFSFRRTCRMSYMLNAILDVRSVRRNGLPLW